MSLHVCKVTTGSVPLLISMPHNGEMIAEEIKHTMTEKGLDVPDTDWCIDVLYDFAHDMGIYTIEPNYNRIVIDLNRDPKGVNLYPGAQSTELCPTSCFDFSNIYLPNQQPDETEIARRIATYWQPYHDQLGSTLQQMRDQYGVAVLLDAHSIRSQVARFFEGQLPDFNFGTADGASCSSAFDKHLAQFDCQPYSQVTNGRFKGGFITRAYGQPEQNIHAVQLELSQRTYMDANEMQYDEKNATQVKVVLRKFVEHLLTFADNKNEAAEATKAKKD